MIAASELRTNDLQAYFNWLLVEHTNVLPGGKVVIQDELPPQFHEGWRNVTGVNLHLSLSREILRAGPSAAPHNAKEMLGDAAKKFLAGATGEMSAAQLDSLDKLGIRLQLKFEGRTERIDTAVLDELAVLLRHEDSGLYQLEVRGIGTVRGDQVKLQRKRSLPHNDGRPDPDAARDAMISYINTLIESGRVRP